MGQISTHGAVGAVVATHHREEALCVWPSALLYVFDPGPVHAERNIVLGLAGNSACVTSDAPVLVYDESVLHNAVSARGVIRS